MYCHSDWSEAIVKALPFVKTSVELSKLILDKCEDVQSDRFLCLDAISLVVDWEWWSKVVCYEVRSLIVNILANWFFGSTRVKLSICHRHRERFYYLLTLGKDLEQRIAVASRSVSFWLVSIFSDSVALDTELISWFCKAKFVIGEYKKDKHTTAVGAFQSQHDYTWWFGSKDQELG